MSKLKMGAPERSLAIPHDFEQVALMGGHRHRGVVFTGDQMRALRRHYGYDAKQASEWEQAGADRNLHRYVEHDGMRLLAALAPYLDSDRDPVLTLLIALDDAGYDLSMEAMAYLEDGERAWQEEE
jgi:hypothetical protein